MRVRGGGGQWSCFWQYVQDRMRYGYARLDCAAHERREWAQGPTQGGGRGEHGAARPRRQPWAVEGKAREALTLYCLRVVGYWSLAGCKFDCHEASNAGPACGPLRSGVIVEFMLPGLVVVRACARV